MRSEQEVRQMIAELQEITDGYGSHTAQAVIAALNNVLHGPDCGMRICACLGPAGCCVCKMLALACPEDRAKD